jgi:hypothetical protein
MGMDRASFLASGFRRFRAHLLPAFTSAWAETGLWEFVSSDSSATAPGSHGIPCAGPNCFSCKELWRACGGKKITLKLFFGAGVKMIFSAGPDSLVKSR